MYTASHVVVPATVSKRERERERVRRLGGARRTFFFFYSPLCNEDSRFIPAARRPVSAFRLPQCALYSPTLKESHALTSSCRLLCAPPPTEERYQDPAEETVSAAISPDDLWARERHRRPPWNLCDRGRVPRGPISRASFARGDGGIPVLRNYVYVGFPGLLWIQCAVFENIGIRIWDFCLDICVFFFFRKWRLRINCYLE